MQLGSASVCATHPSLSLAFREYFQLSEKLDPRAFTVFIANSNTERRRWYRLHKRVIEMSLYTKCHVLFVDDETGRTLGTFSSDELQHFTAQASAVLPIIVSVLRMLCRRPNPSIQNRLAAHKRHRPELLGRLGDMRCAGAARNSTRGSEYSILIMSPVAVSTILPATPTRSPECGVS
jgi:hypothetical protein